MKKLLYAILTILTVFAIVCQPHIGLSQTVNKIAGDVSVQVIGKQRGSGVIIAKNGNTYTVLTAGHVLQGASEVEIISPDGIEEYGPFSLEQVTRINGLDLAVVKFSSSQNYSVVTIGDSDPRKLKEGTTIYIYGWPDPGESITTSKPRIYRTTISLNSSSTPSVDGYALAYAASTREGVSGGPILDENGRLVGIHGKEESVALSSSQNAPTGEKLGIPINSFSRVALQYGINLNASSSLAQGDYPDWFVDNWMKECTPRYNSQSCSCTAKQVMSTFSYKEILDINSLVREGYQPPNGIVELYRSCGINPF